MSQIAFTLFDPQGRSRQRINALSLEEAQLLANLSGNTLVEGTYGADYYLGDNGIVLQIPPAVNKYVQWDWASKSWLDPRTLDDHKAAAWNRIKDARDAVEFGTFTYNNMEFDGDVNAQRRLAGYISVSKTKLAANEPYERMFKLANNDVVMLSAQDFVNIEEAKVNQIADAFTKAEVLRNQIDMATTKEQLDLIQW